MSENENQIEEQTEESQLETLKKRADMMGIKYHPKIGIEKLAKKIDMKLSGKAEEELEEEEITEETVEASSDKPKKKIDPIKDVSKENRPMTEAQYKERQAAKTRKDAGKLVRIRVTCMNPNKTEWEGEIFSVGSAKLGTFKKYVPFNVDSGWHVPHIIYEMIKERKCSIFQTTRGPNGEKIRKAKLIPEFNVEVLDPLTNKELDDLAKQQAMSGSIDQ